MDEKKQSNDLIGRCVSWWVVFTCRHAWQTVVLFLLLTVLLFNYTAGHIGINTDASQMISEKLSWRQTYISYKEKFPQFFGEIAIVVEGATPELANSAAVRLASRLQGEKKLFKSVYLPGGSEFFRRNGLLYLATDELEELSDHLATVQPFLGRLMADQSMRGFFSMLTSAMEAVEDGEDFELRPIMDGIREAGSASLERRFYRLSWQELMLGEKSTASERRRFIVVQPRLDFAELFQGEAAMVKIRALVNELSLNAAHGVRVRLTGSVALANEEFKSVSRGAGVASLAALLAVCCILFVALRSLSLVISSFLVLISGIIGTAAFAAFAVGDLNMISMAFAVLYIGLGIDFAIHLCLRYRELVRRGRAHEEAMREAAGDVGASLVICTITTSVGFYSFIPTAYSGVSELGLISGTGIFISLLTSLTLLPALISLRPLRGTGKAGVRGAGLTVTAERLMARARQRRFTVLVVLTIIGACGIGLLGWVSFDGNPMNLRDSSMESVATFNDLMEEPGSSPLTIMVVKDKGETASSAARLKRLGLVDKAVSINDFIPRGQEEKLDIIEEISLLMGPDLEMEGAGTGTSQSGRFEAISGLEEALRSFASTPALDPAEKAAAESALSVITRLNEKLAAMDTAAREKAIDEFEESLLASLPERLKVLRDSLTAEEVTYQDLPPELIAHWVGKGGSRVIKVFPLENISDPENLNDFVGEVRGIEPEATGLPVVIMESGKTVVRAFKEAFVYALVFIIIILLFLLRDVKYTALVLAPLIYAGILTGAATVLLQIPFNFANIIALPLFLGIGVDNGIHVVHRVRSAPGELSSLLSSSTSRAVLYSALTTLVSFGGLAFSSHRGMASMGQLLMVGLALTVVSTLGVLPLLFFEGKSKDL
ncbi:MAG: MMPL family transporter [Thermodesulfobacteriota bacterium]